MRGVFLFLLLGVGCDSGPVLAGVGQVGFQAGAGAVSVQFSSLMA